MQQLILSNLDNPGQLERLYRSDKPAFRAGFQAVYPDLADNPLAEGWYQRLNYVQESTSWGTRSERVFVVAAALISALIAKLPAIFSLNMEHYYTRNVSFLVFPALIAYFGWKGSIPAKSATQITAFLLAAAIFINVLPQTTPGDSVILACIHLPLLLWSVLGFVFGGMKWRRQADWLGFLRYNGELAVMTALILISGGLTTALTLGLFRLLGLDIEKFYFENVVICGLAALPLIATFLIRAQPTLVNRVSPVIAGLFSPVALVMLVVYLGAMIFSGKNPYQDREFLIIFNALLVGVMALIFFSVAEANPHRTNRAQMLILFLLSGVTMLVNSIALSAVVFRIAEWGVTPNRIAVLGANVLMLIHLVVVGIRLAQALGRKADSAAVGRVMTFFMPVYAGWFAIVTFLFPLIFGFK